MQAFAMHWYHCHSEVGDSTEFAEIRGIERDLSAYLGGEKEWRIA
jgi:hypothetical protein